MEDSESDVVYRVCLKIPCGLVIKEMCCDMDCLFYLFVVLGVLLLWAVASVVFFVAGCSVDQSVSFGVLVSLGCVVVVSLAYGVFECVRKRYKKVEGDLRASQMNSMRPVS